MRKPFNTLPEPPTTVLVGLCLPVESMAQTQAHLQELAALATTRGIVPVATLIQQRKKPCASTWIGSGKAAEIQALVAEKNINSVLFDDELTPGQVNNLTKILGCKVWDRSLLILEIFAQQARTTQAKTQVALAQYQYLLPRLTKMWTHLSRQKGRAGMQGTGEKELETDRRLANNKIHVLKKKLQAIEKQGIIQRSQRNKQVNVTLVGYTNTGKSTLMQQLAKADVRVEDKLFATLSTTVRKVVWKQTPFLLADTVGFIRKLPHTLIACFKSTLAQVREADLLLHVVDFAHPQFEAHIKVVQQTLQEIGAGDIPVLLVFNKIDQFPQLAVGKTSQAKTHLPSYRSALEAYYTQTYRSPTVLVSALAKETLATFQATLFQHIKPLHDQLYPQSQTKS